MTTYIVNGNATSPDITLDGISGVDTDETFVVVTNDKCPVPYLNAISRLCDSHERIIHRKIKKEQKKWFSAYVKSFFMSCLNEPNDRVVIMPSVSISGERIEKYIKIGRVSIENNYGSYRGESANSTGMIDWSNLPKNCIEKGGKMHILVDYENVHNQGLEGAQYLTEDDHVTIFYSSSCENIQQGYFDSLSHKSGSLEVIKLKQQRKNGLDFYIAIRVGEILKQYPGEKILIVSQDQGYSAIQDYCYTYEGMENRIKIAASIESGIAMLDGATERRSIIVGNRSSTSLEIQYEKYLQRKMLYKKISKIFSSTPFASELDRIFVIMESPKTPRELYTSSLHEFGVRSGREIYRLIKDCA